MIGFNMLEFMNAYEIIDPEPELRFDTSAYGSHFHWPDVIKHIEWHKRMTRYYRENVLGKHHVDDPANK